MKGVIVIALRELVCEKFGKDKWKATLEGAGIHKEPVIMAITDVDDATVLKVVGSLCEVLGITLEQAADAFGEYWVSVYSQKMYPFQYRDVSSAREFILKMDSVHASVIELQEDAHPPRFEYDWKDDHTLVMSYQSHRNLIDFMIGLVRGVGKYYGEELQVTKLDDSRAEVVFA